MLVLFEHLQALYGFVPNAIDVANEADYVTATTGTALGHVVVATATRLAAAGFHPEFIGPSVVNRSHAVPFFDEMLAVPGAAAYITELSYHCYYDSLGDSREAIGERVGRAGIGSTQNECWEERNTHVELHRDLKAGRASAWQQGTFNSSYYEIDRKTWQATLHERTKIKRQYYHYIRPGAVRIEAATSDDAMDPLAFIGPDGGRVVVVLAKTAGSVSIERLPPGVYGVTYSTAREFDVHLPDVEVRGTEPVPVTIPADGVLTVAAKVTPDAQ
jgi:O-glycosyl hydrolase